jgi:hypothetical protein
MHDKGCMVYNYVEQEKSEYGKYNEIILTPWNRVLLDKFRVT